MMRLKRIVCDSSEEASVLSDERFELRLYFGARNSAVKDRGLSCVMFNGQPWEQVEYELIKLAARLRIHMTEDPKRAS